jgi:hypothetical protein
VARAICFCDSLGVVLAGSQTGDCASRARATLPNLLGAALQFRAAETNTAMSFDAL